MRHAAALGLVCALASGAALAHPFTVDRLLSLQDLGRTAFSPDGHWLVLDVEAPWSSATRFDLDAKTYLALGRPMIVDIRAGGLARPLLRFEPDTAYSTGAFSPDGALMVLYRLKGRRLEVGVVTLATGEAVWPDLPVDVELSSPTARWRDRDTLVVLSRAPDDSRSLARGWIHQTRSQAAWAAQTAGQRSEVAIGSGRYRAINPPPPMARLMTLDLRTAAIRETAKGAFIDMTLSPDGRRVALVEEGEDIPPGLDPPSVFKPSQRRRLTLVDLTSARRVTPCPTCDLANLPVAWSPDSRSVLAAARLDTAPQAYGYWRLGFDGEPARLSPELTAADSPGSDPRVIGGAAWLGGAPAILARSATDDRLDRWRLSARSPVKLTSAMDASPGPALAATASGLLLSTPSGPVRLTASGKIQPLGPASARLGFPARLAGEAVRAAIITSHGASKPIWPIEGSAWPDGATAHERLLDVLPDRGLSATLASDAQGVRSVVVRDRAGSARTVLTLNADLATVMASHPIAIAHRDPAGQPRTSWLYLPAAPLSEDVPMIVVPYPGAAYSTAPFESQPGVLAFSANTQILTSAGYAVLVPSLPIAADADPSQDLAASILMAVDAARAAHPTVSARRLAIWGQSYGGWGALMAATQTDRFKAVIVTSPITDLFTFYGVISPQTMAAPDRYLALPSLYGWSETGQGRMLGPPWTDMARNLRNSPALLTDKITAPVMLVTSDNDFTSGQSQPVFSALYRQNKDAQLVSYRGEAHVVISPDNVRDLYARAFAFLADALGAPAAPTDVRPSQ